MTLLKHPCDDTPFTLLVDGTTVETWVMTLLKHMVDDTLLVDGTTVETRVMTILMC